MQGASGYISKENLLLGLPEAQDSETRVTQWLSACSGSARNQQTVEQEKQKKRVKHTRKYFNSIRKRRTSSHSSAEGLCREPRNIQQRKSFRKKVQKLQVRRVSSVESYLEISSTKAQVGKFKARDSTPIISSEMDENQSLPNYTCADGSNLELIGQSLLNTSNEEISIREKLNQAFLETSDSSLSRVPHIGSSKDAEPNDLSENLPSKLSFFMDVNQRNPAHNDYCTTEEKKSAGTSLDVLEIASLETQSATPKLPIKSAQLMENESRSSGISLNKRQHDLEEPRSSAIGFEETRRKRRQNINQDESWNILSTLLTVLESKSKYEVVEYLRKDNWDFENDHINLHKLIESAPHSVKGRPGTSYKTYLKRQLQNGVDSYLSKFSDRLKDFSPEAGEKLSSLLKLYLEKRRYPEKNPNVSNDIGPSKSKPAPFTFKEKQNMVKAILQLLQKYSVNEVKTNLSSRWDLLLGEKTVQHSICSMPGTFPNRPAKSFASKWNQMLKFPSEIYDMFREDVMELDNETIIKFETLIGRENP